MLRRLQLLDGDVESVGQIPWYSPLRPPSSSKPFMPNIMSPRPKRAAYGSNAVATAVIGLGKGRHRAAANAVKTNAPIIIPAVSHCFQFTLAVHPDFYSCFVKLCASTEVA
ncbi:MAG: hypothetical protein IPM07_26935 [Anaerolineales bacterium]|nr:hypothetical protein [Anaerolineales bacterium]